MKRILLLLPLLLLGCKPPPAKMGSVRMKVTNVSSGASQATLQAAFNAGGTVNLAAGNYSINSQLNVPCNNSGVTISGAPVGVNQEATTIISGSFGRSFLIAVNSCAFSSGLTIQYLGLNGGRPSGGGGGGIYFHPGVSNVTVRYNTIWGNQGVRGQYTNYNDNLIWFDGSNGNSPVDSNIHADWNILGKQGDCSNIMNDFVDDGGYCVGIGIHSPTSNSTFSFNRVAYQEEGIKTFQGQATCNGCTFNNDDYAYIHRIAHESQMNPNPAMIINNNSYHDPYCPYWSSFGLSEANGVADVTHTDGNLMIANVTPLGCGYPGNNYIAMAIETWGSGSTATNNVIQGYWANGDEYNWLGNFNISNNIFCGPGTPGHGMNYINKATGIRYTATTNNNSMGPNCSQLTSTTPVINQTTTAVTLTDSGPNHSIYYTVDGSTPTPATGTPYTGPFSPATGVTVKAVGMWGSFNQPKSYPAGYGYAPSAVVSAVYTGTGGNPNPPPPPPPTDVLKSAYLAAPNDTNKLSIGQTLQFTAMGIYSSSSTPTAIPNGSVTWSSSNLAVMTVASSGLATAVSSGSASIQAVIGSITSSPWTVTVSTPVVTTLNLSAGTYTVIIPGTATVTGVGVVATKQTPAAITVKNGADGWKLSAGERYTHP